MPSASACSTLICQRRGTEVVITVLCPDDASAAAFYAQTNTLIQKGEVIVLATREVRRG